MTDSESDLSNPNVFTLQNVNTTVSARGPNTNITNFSFRNNQLTSSMHMPRNFERQRYAESVSDQRSIYYRREASPMSIHSACDIRPRNFQQYYNGMGSHQSVFNGRSGSPVSMRSIDSSASVSAADIAFAFKNVKFNKYDLRVIKEAYNKLMKQRFRKRIEKRRNMRLFLKGNRHRSGDDSGEQGSDSSISSDDCRSVKTSYKENMSCSSSARMNLTDFRKAVRDNNMLKDCTESIRQKHVKNNMFSINTSQHHVNNSSVSKQSLPVPSLKDRFKNGFVLPSQRFNRSVASSVIPENSENYRNMEVNHRQNESISSVSNKQPQSKFCESGSEEEIFSGVSIRDKSVHNPHKEHPKRTLDSEDESSLPEKKRSKISSPVKNSQANRKVPSATKNNNPVNNNNENTNNFEFAKPSLPVRKSKPKVQEKIIAKSKQPLTGFVEPMPNNIPNNIEPATKVQEKANDNESQDDNLESTHNSEVSMRPSFIKRKLFTQKLDVAEKANLSCDGTNSPKCNGYSGLQKEKNKARKLVTSLSCLNREVQEENNLLDLIHKIVPLDQMNVTNQTTINQTKTDVNNSNKKDDDDKWDVTSVISMCNENDVSDTFTDEEIFGSDNKSKDAKKSNKENGNAIPKSNSTKPKHTAERNNKVSRECRIVVENINCNQVIQRPVENQNNNLTNTTESVSKITVKNSAKTFWDTDFESDAECQLTTQKSYMKDNNQTRVNMALESYSQDFKQPIPPVRSPVAKARLQVPETSRWLNNTKNNTIMNNTLDSTRKFNISSLSVRSHRTTQKKKCCNEVCFQELKSTKSVTNVKNALNPDTKGTKNYRADAKTKTTSKAEDKNETKSDDRSKTTSKSKEKSKTTSKNDEKSTTTSKSEERSKTTSKSKESSKTKSNSEQKSKTTPKLDDKNKTTSKSEQKTKTTSKSDDKNKTTSKTDVKNKTTSKSDVKNKIIHNSENGPAKTRPTSTEPKSYKKMDSRNKTPTKSEQISQDADKSRSTSGTRQKSKERKSKLQKQIESATNISNLLSPKDRPIRSCRTSSQNRSIENSRSSRQFEISPLKVIANRPIRKNGDYNDTSVEKSTLEINCKPKVGQVSDEADKKTPEKNHAKKVDENKTLTKRARPASNKSVTTSRAHKSPHKTRSKTSKQIPKNMSSHQTPKCDRPIRSCRTPGQNRSIDNYKSSIRGR